MVQEHATTTKMLFNVKIQKIVYLNFFLSATGFVQSFSSTGLGVSSKNNSEQFHHVMQRTVKKLNSLTSWALIKAKQKAVFAN